MMTMWINMRWTMPLSALLLLLTACNSSKPPETTGKAEEPVAPVEVATVTKETLNQIVTAPAVLFPANQANVMTKISAPVKQFYVKRGDKVRAGQLLAVLESRDLAASVAESKGLWDQAKAVYETTTGATMPEDLVKAQTDVRSAQQAYDAAKKLADNRVVLVKEGALAQKLADDARVLAVQAQSALETARRHLTSLETVARPEQVRGGRAQVDAAKARYDSAVAQLSYAEIRSPINGEVSDRPLFAGEIASAGTAVVSIVDESQVIAKANIPVKEASVLRAGKVATITGPGGELTGKVTVVSPAVDPSTTTVEVWVQAANAGGRMKSGVSVQIAIQASKVADALTVPASAILTLEEGGEKVMVVGADSAAHEKKITIGVRDGEKVQLLDGVKEGDRVITSGGLGLEDKAKVKVSAPAAAEKEK